MSFVLKRQFLPVQKWTGHAARFPDTGFYSQMALTYPQVGLCIQHLKCLDCLHCSVSETENSSPVVWVFERKMEGFLNPCLLFFVLHFSLILSLKLILLMSLMSEWADDLILLFSYRISEFWTAPNKKSFVASVVLLALLHQSHSWNTKNIFFV